MPQRDIVILIGALALITAVGAGIFYGIGGSPEDDTLPALLGNQAVAPEDIEPTIPETQAVSAGWRSYESVAFKFGIHFPENFSAREYKESDGALSVVFENPQKGEGFQIYVVPYDKDHITDEQFRKDISSGVMKEPTDIIVAGVPATMFFSENSIMGETREVWFIKNGLLYEVVTYKALDSWLGTIMQTWRFL